MIRLTRVEFPLFEVQSYPSMNLTNIKNRRFMQKCPVCEEICKNVIEHAMERNDDDHIIYVIHSM